jgi:chromatin remodeling complex protein RSC6
MAKSKQGSAKPASTGKTTSSQGTRAARSGALQQARGGLARPVTPSLELGAIVGTEPLSRAELTQRVWEYIKSHELQDTQDRRQINADAQLKKVLGKDRVSMFEMTKLLNQHVK